MPDETNLKGDINSHWGSRIAVFLAAVAAVRVAFILFAPLELSGDEAQYWDWSRQMAWGYFSKGPVVAACIWLGRMLFGETVLAVRGPAVALATGAGVAIFLLGRRLYNGRVGFWAAALSQIVPIFAAFGIGMTADPPFLLCWSLALLLFHRAADANRWADWLGLAVVLGVGLNAKYTMGLFYPCAFVYLLKSRQHRRVLAGVRPWLAVAISLAMLGPLLWWDSQHGWVNMLHNAGHTGYGSHGGLKPLGLLKFLGTQLAMVTPVLAVMLVWAVVRRARKDPFCFWFCIPVLGLFLFKSVSGHDYANWTLPAYVTGLFAFSAAFLQPPVSANVHIRRLTRSAWLTPAIATPVIMLLVMLGHFSYLLDDAGLPAQPEPLPQVDRLGTGRPGHR